MGDFIPGGTLFKEIRYLFSLLSSTRKISEIVEILVKVTTARDPFDIPFD